MPTIALTKETFEQTIVDNDMVLVDFWAEWCGPCRQFAPVYERVSEQYPDAVFAKVDTETEPELAQHFNIRSIPTLMIFKEQVGIFSQPGALPEPVLTDLLDQASDLDMDEVRKEIAEHEHAHTGHPHDDDHVEETSLDGSASPDDSPEDSADESPQDDSPELATA